MDRRGFFKVLGIGLGGIALEQAIPFGRVWSFPSEIVIPEYEITTAWISLKVLEILKKQLIFERPFDGTFGRAVRFNYQDELLLDHAHYW